MATLSPPKPWERTNGSYTTATPAPSAPVGNGMPPNSQSDAEATNPSSSNAPALPPKPSSLSSIVNRNASNYSPYASGNTFGATPYGGLGGYNNYASPYNRFGGMGGSIYGGYGFGGMGGGMYGGYPGRPGMMGEDPNSLTNSFNQSTQATFQIIESIVGAFGGFAQMLESTYYATQSSFFAMISVAEQFTNLRDTLGSILGIFWLLRWIRTAIAKVTGRPPPADATSLTPSAFARFQGRSGSATLPDGTPLPPRPSKKPFLFFLLAAFGLPYVMGKMIRALARSQEQAAQRQQGLLMGPDGQSIPGDQPDRPVDFSQLDFCRVLHDYKPETTGHTLRPGLDMEVKKGDFVAVLSRKDPLGNPSDWWRCRSRDGQTGYLPGPYLEFLRKGETLKQLPATSPPESRAQTMSTERSSVPEAVKVPVPGIGGVPNSGPGMSDITVESFQRSQFYQ